MSVIFRTLGLLFGLVLFGEPASLSAIAQTNTRPLILPVGSPPGPSTWLMGQPYGNTTGAFNFGSQWYEAGQGLHFGIDLSMPCGTPLVAAADGEVFFVDDLGFGSGPHNLLIYHPAHNVVSLYGHLLDRPTVVVGQFVRQGEQVALSGDPDSTCDSRPHLHYELRAAGYRTTYNPMNWIDANWHALAAFGSFSYPLFQQDMLHPRRWMSLYDQPDVNFGGVRLNNYSSTYPPANSQRAAARPPLARQLPPLAATVTVSVRQLTNDSCCARHWWSTTNADLFYVVDGIEGQNALTYAWSVSSGTSSSVGTAPLPETSSDEQYEVIPSTGQMTIRRRADNASWVVQTENRTPSISAGSSQLLWTVSDGINVPGGSAPNTTVWISNLNGANARAVVSEPGVNARWLDDTRLLLTIPGDNRTTTLDVYDTATNQRFSLGTWAWLRNVTVAPGGGRLMFLITSQQDLAANGVFTIETVSGAQPVRMPWFGAWRWRDADSVFYLPFNPSDPFHTLAYFHIPTRTNIVLTDPAITPFLIANGDWDISADGARVLFQNALDGNLWLLNIG